MDKIQALSGILFFIMISFLLSEKKKSISVRAIVLGILTQFVIAVLLLKVPAFKDIFLYLNKIVVVLEEATRAGTSVVFGYLGGGSLPFDEKFPGSSYILVFRSLPLILVMSALSSLLFYWKILPKVVKAFSKILEKTFKIGGAEGLGVSANIFVGMVEAPLLVRPYLSNMTRSELFSIMVCGMSTIAGTMMVIYASIIGSSIPNALGHILTASVISAPASVMIAKIMIPETERITVDAEITYGDDMKSSMDAITTGTSFGIKLFFNIAAMIIVLIAIVYLINACLSLVPEIYGHKISLQYIIGIIFSPVMWVMGIPWNECLASGSIMGTKTVLNEFIAYLDLAKLSDGSITVHSRTILTYALCGFANPGSLGIMIGGLGAMVPERRNEILSLGLRSIVAGTIVTCMTGTIAGIIL